MALFIFEVSSFDLAGSQVIAVLIFTLARFAPVPQAIVEGAAFAELALVFPLSAFVTLLHLQPAFCFRLPNPSVFYAFIILYSFHQKAISCLRFFLICGIATAGVRML
jgi:uncharacterized membrane protein YcgQ (UPF0703/DUF1980 family)